MNLARRREGRKDAVIALLFPIFYPVIPAFSPAILAFYPVIPAFSPVIPAKAGIQRVGDGVGTRPPAKPRLRASPSP